MQPRAWATYDAVVNISSTASLQSVGGCVLSASAAGSATWPTAATAIFVPFRLAAPLTVAQMWWYNGTLVGTPNTDAGIYTRDGKRVCSSGGIAQSGGSVLQAANVTDTRIDAGIYYMALVQETNASAMFRYVIVAATTGRAMGVKEMASAYPLPASATMVVTTQAYMPVFGLTSKATL